MIEIWSYREKGGPEILLGNRYAELSEALTSLCKYELGYGGVITDVADERLEVTTLIFHCKDRTVYAGPKEEMNDLLLAAHLWMKAEKEVSFEEWWTTVAKVSKGKALLVAVSAGLVRGDLVAKKLVEQLQGMS